MFLTRAYYKCKPFIPRSVRLGARRVHAARNKSKYAKVWPIKESAARKPEGWTGWPEGKQFAAVLTHDVESEAGLDRVRQLAELEIELGFRSSFNFIPEGPYRVSKDLREWLVRNGFEVGVHDLHHDGRLYQSRTEFVQKSKRINHYLREWNAKGFRSGFMLNELDWLHDLEIVYDASTFDTDPFEPQPQGRDTIFPFWLPRPRTADSGSASSNGSRQGYVELPYTLPQDSTLFLLLRESTPQIWLTKLDWIARHGGMALVDVHPDYIHFDDEPASNLSYPARHYRTLLEHIRSFDQGSFWQPLPHQLAEFVTQLELKPSVCSAKRVCMVTHSFYESDNRVTRYAEALVARGDHVDVFALRRSPEMPTHELIQGVNVFRIQDRFSKNERSKLAYLWPLLRFLKASAARVMRRHRESRYDLLHVHNVPDFLVFASWYPKLTGAKVILDIHDIVPEFFGSKFAIPPNGMILKLLRWMERISASFADHIIIANHLWLEKYAKRTRATGRCTPFVNNVDCNIFVPEPTKKTGDKLIILFPGGLQWHQGVDIALRAFSQVRAELPNVEFHIYGDGSEKDSLIGLADELQLNGSVRFFKPTSVREIATVMAQADLGVVPKRADSFGNEAYSTKIMEFMAVGVPVIVSNTKVDRFYFDDSVVCFFESGNAHALAQKMLELLRNPDLRRELILRASEYAAQNSWQRRKSDYLEIVDSICARRGWSHRRRELPRVDAHAASLDG
jgi:glycosyltransferase involved in cell wall biosynthesis